MKIIKYIFPLFLICFLFANISCNEPLPSMKDATGILNSSHIGWTKTDCAQCHAYQAIIRFDVHKDIFAGGADGYKLCYVCHGDNGMAGGGNPTISACGDCHKFGAVTAQAVTAKYLFTHSSIMQSDATKCITCHSTQGHPGASGLIQRLDCAPCHDKTTGAFKYNHVDKGQCYTCHLANGFNGAAETISHKMEFIKSENCISCHKANSEYAPDLNKKMLRTHPKPFTKYNDADCLTCHVVTLHPARKTTFQALGNNQCYICHDGAFAQGDHGDGRDCTSCHVFVGLVREADGSVRSPAHTRF